MDRFTEMYDENLDVFDTARPNWKKVDLAKGKGRLVREKKNSAVGCCGFGCVCEIELFHALMVFLLGGLCWDRQTPSLIYMFI